MHAVIIGRMATFPELLQTRSALLADVDRDPRAPERLLVRSDLTGTMQLYELSPPDGLRQMTALDEPVGSAFYVPGSRQAALEVDRGGDERHQLYVIDLEDTNRSGPAGFEDLTALTDDPAHGHHICGISPNGVVLAYLSNKHNGIDFDLWTCDLQTGEHRLDYSANSWLQPASGFSPDGRWISVLRPGPRPLDTDLLLVDTSTFEARVVLEHPDEGAQVGGPAWSTPSVFYVSSNVGRDHAPVVRYDLETGAASAIEGYGDAWDAEPITSSDGSTLAVVENHDGASAISVTEISPSEREDRDPPARARRRYFASHPDAHLVCRRFEPLLHVVEPAPRRRCLGRRHQDRRIAKTHSEPIARRSRCTRRCRHCALRKLRRGANRALHISSEKWSPEK